VLTFDWSFAHLIAPVVITTSITFSFNRIKNGDILVPANPDPPGKLPLKWREGERRERHFVSFCGLRAGGFGEQDRHSDERDSPYISLCCLMEPEDHTWLITLRLSLLSSTAGAQSGRTMIIESCTRSLDSSFLPSHHSTLTPW